MFCFPYFSGVDISGTNAHGIHWTIGAIFVKFSQLIITKIIKIVATRCQILRLCTKFNFGWSSAPDPVGGAYSAPPDSLAGFNGLLLRGVKGKRGSGGVPFTIFCGFMPMRDSRVATTPLWC